MTQRTEAIVIQDERIAELEDALKQRDRRIAELTAELDNEQTRVAEMGEYVTDARDAAPDTGHRGSTRSRVPNR